MDIMCLSVSLAIFSSGHGKGFSKVPCGISTFTKAITKANLRSVKLLNFVFTFVSLL